MARSLLSYERSVEEDYIDMDISLCYTIPSPPHTRDFEFQMSTKSVDIDRINSPADELFYKGKLLPLHLPPRLELVQKLLQDSTPTHHGNPDHRFDESISVANTAAANTAAATPYVSCNISPATSCYVSGELDPEDYFGECQKHKKKSWSKKLKLIKTTSLGIKLKAYLRSLLIKSGCSDESFAVPKPKVRSTGEKMVEQVRGHRRSFSEVIKGRSLNKYSSSSCSSADSSNSSSFSSVNSTGFEGPQVLKRISSVNSEVECSIQGAIAYCKKSHQEVHERKSVSDVEFYTLSASRIAVDCGKEERPEISRG